MPSVHFTIKYEVVKNELQITINYKIADYIQNLPRFGLEFAIAKSYNKFAYIGYVQLKVILINILLQNMDIMKLQQKKIMI